VTTFRKNNRKSLTARGIAIISEQVYISNLTSPQSSLPMWQKLKEQIPTILITTMILIVAGYWINQRNLIVQEASRQTELAPLREQNDALKAAAEVNRQQIAAVDQLLKDAIAKRQADLFMTDEEISKLNQEKVEALADAIARRVQPYNAIASTPEEAEKLQREQIDKVSSRMATNIQPILSELAADQNLTRETIIEYSQRISDQLGSVLAGELAKTQRLNNNLMQTQAAAQEALSLSHETTALYLSSFKDQGLITRLLSLPANIVKDVAQLNIVDKRDKDEIAKELVDKMSDIEERLKAIRAQQPNGQPVVEEAKETTKSVEPVADDSSESSE
tara:strand:+ start:463 stop:1464 length:1002 start_codon:yes stop_codon:yes gene_type:complete